MFQSFEFSVLREDAMTNLEAGSAAAPAVMQSVGVTATGLSSSLVSAQNAAVQTIPLPPSRIAELPPELNQLLAATLGNRSRLDFDIEPSCFVVSLSRPGNISD